MLLEGRAQGFHIDYFPKGHSPTDFDRWAAVAIEENVEGIEPCHAVCTHTSYVVRLRCRSQQSQRTLLRKFVSNRRVFGSP